MTRQVESSDSEGGQNYVAGNLKAELSWRVDLLLEGWSREWVCCSRDRLGHALGKEQRVKNVQRGESLDG
jgi:hypothetical protein